MRTAVACIQQHSPAQNVCRVGNMTIAYIKALKRRCLCTADAVRCTDEIGTNDHDAHQIGETNRSSTDRMA